MKKEEIIFDFISFLKELNVDDFLIALEAITYCAEDDDKIEDCIIKSYNYLQNEDTEDMKYPHSWKEWLEEFKNEF